MDEITKLTLKSLMNTRDLGGLKTEGGKRIKQGILFRSGTLYKLPKNTVKSLESLNISTVIDLRTDGERAEKPDVSLSGCKYIYCPLICTATPGITYEEKIRKTMAKEGRILAEKYGTSDNYMIEMYKHMVTDENSVSALGLFFRTLLETNGNVLFHCNSGKDRVGVCAMLLESILGVGKETVLTDYIASRAFCRMKFFWYKVGLIIAPITFKFKKFLFCMMRTKKIYVTETMKYLEERYGSVLDFCKAKLGLNDGDFSTLKNKYLE